jgi:glycosyltransferase involved in cell wall biosynthesis
VSAQAPYPRISIVVPSFNQGKYLGETLQSLVSQEYPKLEVIIQDGLSTDNSLEVAQTFRDRYPGIFQIFSQKDRNQAHALNLGFEKTTGEILGFLNSDDTLYPGCLHRVSKEIDPSRNRWIVMGRCLFVGQGMPYVGLEHPSEFKGHFHLLAIWRTGINTIPQPSVFWHRNVWTKCGGLDEKVPHAVDYDLFCRFSKYFYFHKIDELWSTYRLHGESKTSLKTEEEVFEISIATSRRHWGEWWSFLRWRCEVSYFLSNPAHFSKAKNYAVLAERAVAAGDIRTATINALRAGIASPAVFWHRLFLPFIRSRLPFSIRNLRLVQTRRLQNVPRGRYGDGWIGPCFTEQFEIPANAHILILTLGYEWPCQTKNLVRILVDGAEVRRIELEKPAVLDVSLDVRDHAGTKVQLEILSEAFFRPRDYGESRDERPLCLMLKGVKFAGGAINGSLEPLSETAM